MEPLITKTLPPIGDKAIPCCIRRQNANLLERLNKEIKQRTCVAALFPNEASLLRLVSAVLMEISEE